MTGVWWNPHFGNKPAEILRAEDVSGHATADLNHFNFNSSRSLISLPTGKQDGQVTILCDAFEVCFCLWRQTNCTVQRPLLVHLEMYCSIFWTNELFYKLFTFPRSMSLEDKWAPYKHGKRLWRGQYTWFLFFKPQQPLKSCSDCGFTVTGVSFYSVQLRNTTVAPCSLLASDSKWVHMGGGARHVCSDSEGKNRETKTKDEIQTFGLKRN